MNECRLSYMRMLHAKGYGMMALPNHGDPDSLGENNPPPGWLFISTKDGVTPEQMVDFVDEYLKGAR